MREKLLLLACIAVRAAAAAPPISFQTHYIGLGLQDTSVALAADTAGNIFIVSAVVNPSTRLTGTRITKTDPNGNVLGAFNLDQDYTHIPAAVTVDRQGNPIITGSVYAAP